MFPPKMKSLILLLCTFVLSCRRVDGILSNDTIDKLIHAAYSKDVDITHLSGPVYRVSWPNDESLVLKFHPKLYVNKELPTMSTYLKDENSYRNEVHFMLMPFFWMQSHLPQHKLGPNIRSARMDFFAMEDLSKLGYRNKHLVLYEDEPQKACEDFLSHQAVKAQALARFHAASSFLNNYMPEKPVKKDSSRL